MSDEEIFDYYLWQLRRAGSAAFSLDITPGEKWNSPSPSEMFLEKLSDRLRLASPIVLAQLQPFRTSYYSDPAADDWEDVWRLGWCLTFELQNELETLPRWQNEYLGLVGYDSETLDKPAPKKTNCMVVAEFMKKRKSVDVRKAIASDPDFLACRNSIGAPEPHFERHTLAGLVVQERISLGQFEDSFYREGAEYARLTERLCEDLGAFTDFETRSLEFDELYDEDGLV